MQQCDNVKLQKKIIAEDLKFEDIVKYEIALEQGDKKVQRINEDAEGRSKSEKVKAVVDSDKLQQLQEDIRALKNKNKKVKSQKICSTCPKVNHPGGKCYAVKLSCHA